MNNQEIKISPEILNLLTHCYVVKHDQPVDTTPYTSVITKGYTPPRRIKNYLFLNSRFIIVNDMMTQPKLEMLVTAAKNVVASLKTAEARKSLNNKERKELFQEYNGYIAACENWLLERIDDAS